MLLSLPKFSVGEVCIVLAGGVSIGTGAEDEECRRVSLCWCSYVTNLSSVSILI